MKLFKKVGILLILLSFISLGVLDAKTTKECTTEYGDNMKVLVDALNKDKTIDSATYNDVKKKLDQAFLSCKLSSEDKKKQCTSEGKVWDSVKGCIGGVNKEDNELKLKKEACEAIGEKYFNGSCSGSLDKTTLGLTVNPSTGNKYTVDEIEKITGGEAGGVTAGGTSSGEENNFIINNVPTVEEYCSRRKSGHKDNGLLGYDGGVCDSIDGKQTKENNGYTAFIKTANDVIGWIVNIALLIAAAMAFYGGFLYISSATDPSARTKANKLFTNIAIGLFLIFAAWFIVKFILTVFAKGDATTTNVGQKGNYTGLQE